jgi:hypothetical protein
MVATTIIFIVFVCFFFISKSFVCLLLDLLFLNQALAATSHFA